MIFEPWIQLGQIAFGRRVVHEMCYYCMLKLYRLNTAHAALNDLIAEEWFLDFHIETPKGLLLRSLASTEQLPVAKLKRDLFGKNSVKCSRNEILVSRGLESRDGGSWRKRKNEADQSEC